MWPFVETKSNKQERLFGCMLETEIVLVPRIHYHRFTVNAQFVTLISGLPMNKLSPRSGIVRLVRKVEKRTILKGSILP